MLVEYRNAFLPNQNGNELASNEIYSLYNVSRIIRSRTVFVVVIIVIIIIIIIVDMHLYVTKKNEK
jgi:hypothetical protein